MGLSKIKDILRKYTLKIPRDKIIKEVFCEVIKETFNHVLTTGGRFKMMVAEILRITKHSLNN